MPLKDGQTQSRGKKKVQRQNTMALKDEQTHSRGKKSAQRPVRNLNRQTHWSKGLLAKAPEHPPTPKHHATEGRTNPESRQKKCLTSPLKPNRQEQFSRVLLAKAPQHLPTPKHHATEGRTNPESQPKKCLTSLLKPQ